MTYNSKIINEGSVLHRKYFGNIELDFILQSWEEDITKELVPNSLIGVINDFSDAILNVQIHEIEALMGFYKSYSNSIKPLKIAVVVNSPEGIVIPLTVERDYPEFNIKAFSFIEYAMNWVSSDH